MKIKLKLILLFFITIVHCFSQDVKIQELSPNVIIIQHKADGVPKVDADTLDFYDINQKKVIKRIIVDEINTWTIDKGIVYIYWKPKSSFYSNLTAITSNDKITTKTINIISTLSEFYNNNLMLSGIDTAYSKNEYLYKLDLAGKILEKKKVEVKNNIGYSLDASDFTLNESGNYDSLATVGKMKYSNNYLYFPGRKLPNPMFSIIHSAFNDRYYAFNNRVGDEQNTFNTYFYDKKGDLISIRKELVFKTFMYSNIYMVSSNKIYVLSTPEDYPWIINLSSFRPSTIVSLK